MKMKSTTVNFDTELDISEIYTPNDYEDDGLVEPLPRPHKNGEDDDIFNTPQYRQRLEDVLVKLNYNNVEDVLFSSNVKLYKYVNNSWVGKGLCLLKIVRELEAGPCHGITRLVVYRVGSLVTLVNHTLEEEMKVIAYIAFFFKKKWSRDV